MKGVAELDFLLETPASELGITFSRNAKLDKLMVVDVARGGLADNQGVERLDGGAQVRDHRQQFAMGDGDATGAVGTLRDGEAVDSCLTLTWTVAGRVITTVAGLVRDGRRHPLVEAFIRHGAVQCGYCTPGLIIAAHSLLRVNPDPDDEEHPLHGAIVAGSPRRSRGLAPRPRLGQTPGERAHSPA